MFVIIFFFISFFYWMIVCINRSCGIEEDQKKNTKTKKERAHGGDWTRGLFVKSEPLYHWVTKAICVILFVCLFCWGGLIILWYICVHTSVHTSARVVKFFPNFFFDHPKKQVVPYLNHISKVKGSNNTRPHTMIGLMGFICTTQVKTY